MLGRRPAARRSIRDYARLMRRSSLGKRGILASIVLCIAATAVAVTASCTTQPSSGPAAVPLDQTPEGEPPAPEPPVVPDPSATGTTSPPPATPASSSPGPIPTPAGPAPEQIVSGRGTCKSDGDCVPAECCHPKGCSSRSLAPSCAATMCTMNCAPQSLDCGGGTCFCHDGECAARMKTLLLTK
jgi:hypothetical protein